MMRDKNCQKDPTGPSLFPKIWGKLFPSHSTNKLKHMNLPVENIVDRSKSCHVFRISDERPDTMRSEKRIDYYRTAHTRKNELDTKTKGMDQIHLTSRNDLMTQTKYLGITDACTNTKESEQRNNAQFDVLRKQHREFIALTSPQVNNFTTYPNLYYKPLDTDAIYNGNDLLLTTTGRKNSCPMWRRR